MKNRIDLQFFAEVDASATSTPKASMQTEVYYSETYGGARTQLFTIQEVPALQAPKEPVTYGSLESTSEMQTSGTRKAEAIAVPLLYVEDQHDTLKAFADAGTKLYFTVKLPDATAVTTGKPKTFEFSGTIDIALDTIAIDGMIAENMTIYKDSVVTESEWTASI